MFINIFLMQTVWYGESSSGGLWYQLEDWDQLFFF